MTSKINAPIDYSYNTVVSNYLQGNLTGRPHAYSSKDMNGKYCLAFIYDSFNSYLHDCINLIINFDRDRSGNLNIDRLQSILASASQDNIGCNSLIFYFPTLNLDINLSTNEENNLN